MKCPICEHESEKALKKCSMCESIFDSHGLEELQQANYTLAWLDDQVHLLDPDVLDQLRRQIGAKIKQIRGELRLDEIWEEFAARAELSAPQIDEQAASEPLLVDRDVEEMVREFALRRAVIANWPNWMKRIAKAAPEFGRFDSFMRARAIDLRKEILSLNLEPMPEIRSKPSELEAIDFALTTVPDWQSERGESPSSVDSITELLQYQRESVAKTIHGPIVAPRPIRKVKSPEPTIAKEPPKPKEPLFDWAKIRQGLVDAAASGALLRGLLYLGAFMIVVSIAVLVIYFWEQIPTWLQFGFIAAVPTAFYLAGWLIRSKLKLPQAGSVLTGIGMLLVAVDFIAVFRFGGFEDLVDPDLYWFIASLFCTGLYAVTVWRVPLETFGYITLLALTSTLISLGFLLRLEMGFIVAMIPIASVIMLIISNRLSRIPETWAPLARSARRLPYVLLPFSQLLVLFASGNFGLSQAVTCLVASIGYGMLAVALPVRELWRGIFSHAASWSSAGAIGFALVGAEVRLAWFATAAAIVSPFYLAAGRYIEIRRPWDEAARRTYLWALYVTGFGLLGLATAGGLITLAFDTWPGVIALTIVSLVLAGCAYLFRRHHFVLAASGLFILPYSIAFNEWLLASEASHTVSWLMACWAILALAYTGLAYLLGKAYRFAMWLYLVANLLAPLVVLGVGTDYFIDANSWIALPAIIALCIVVLVYLCFSLILAASHHRGLTILVSWLPKPFDRSAFLWPLAVVFPIFITAIWLGMKLDPAWLGVLFGVVALAYVALGQAVTQWDIVFRLPFHIVAYLLPVSGIILALNESWALLLVLLLSVTVLISLAAIYRRVWEVAGASILFIWPFQLALEMSSITSHAYSLAYALLAAFVYIPIAMALTAGRLRDSWIYDRDRLPSWNGTPMAMAVFFAGYGLSAYAVGASLLGRFDLYPQDIRWLGALVPAIVCGLMIFSDYRLRQRFYAWIAIFLLAITYWQTLTLIRVPSEYHALAWVILAFGLLLLERLVIQRSSREWWSDFGWPSGIGSVALCLLGVTLTIYPTYQVLVTGETETAFPLIAAQSAAAFLTISAAWLHKNRLPLFIEPVLAFFPVTLFFMAYSQRFIGSSLEPAHFSYVWLGFAALHLVAAALVDSQRVRYSHGLYLGGYTALLLALGWSMQDWQTEIVSLGILLIFATATHLLVHFDRHRSWDEFIALAWKKPGSVGWRAARATFLFIAVYSFPIWLVQLLAFNDISLAWRGAACALVAPLYIALGLWLRTIKKEYTWPLYSAGYALTAVGAMIAYNDQRLFIAVLTLNAVVYAVSSYIFRQAFWLYITNTLVPIIVLLALDYNGMLSAPWIAGIFMGIAFVFIACGWWFDRRSVEREITPFALPFYVCGYLLSAISLAVASDERTLAIAIYTAAVGLYLVSARVFRESIFLYPAAWLAVVPYFLLITLTTLPTEWWGLGMLPLVIVYIAAGRLLFHKLPLEFRGWSGILRSLGRPEMPFYLLAYAASIGMVTLSLFVFNYSDSGGLSIMPRADTLPLAVSLVAASAVYFGSAALFHLSTWLYPGLLAGHLALLAALGLSSSGSPAYYTSLPFAAATWIVALTGLAFERRSSKIVHKKMPHYDLKFWRIEITLGGWDFGGRLMTRSWSQPFYVFVALDAILWQIVALGGYDTATIVAVSFAILMGLLATLWQDGSLVYISLVYLVIASGVRLGSAGLTYAQTFAFLGAIGFALYFIAELMALIKRLASRFTVWCRPMERTAVVLAVLTVVGTLPTAPSQTLATAVALGFSGALFLAIAYRGRRYSLGYLAMAMLQIAWVLLLLERNVSQPQLYAMPAGLYFIVIGELERRRNRIAFANYLCAFGLAVIFMTSFIQSLDSQSGLPYFILLLFESLLAIAYGVFMQEKIPFFGGLAAAFLNVTGQLILLATVSEPMRWIVILGIGLGLVAVAISVERRREHIASQIEEWRTTLSTWS